MGRRVGRLSAQLWDDGTASAPWKCLTRGVSSAKKLRLKSGLKAHTWSMEVLRCLLGLSQASLPSVPSWGCARALSELSSSILMVTGNDKEQEVSVPCSVHVPKYPMSHKLWDPAPTSAEPWEHAGSSVPPALPKASNSACPWPCPESPQPLPHPSPAAKLRGRGPGTQGTSSAHGASPEHLLLIPPAPPNSPALDLIIQSSPEQL